jgi:hypothetical protein
MAAKKFLILMKWTQKGVGEIDNALDRRQKAINLMPTYIDSAGNPLHFPTGPDTDIITFPADKKSHVQWTVMSEDKPTVQDFAKEMEYHGYVNCLVKKG